jgi:hypothetical protein
MSLDFGGEDPQGFYRSNFIGEAHGNIDSGLQVVSNSTGGVGNLTGYIHPQKTAIFQVVKDINTFVSSDGERMTFQNKTGANNITLIKAFLEFILQYDIYNVTADTFQALSNRKAWRIKFQYDNGKDASATLVVC